MKQMIGYEGFAGVLYRENWNASAAYLAGEAADASDDLWDFGPAVVDVGDLGSASEF